MPNKDEIKRAMLDAAGNPESGAVFSAVEEMAKAVDKLLNPAPAFDKSDRETQVVKPLEKR